MNTLHHTAASKAPAAQRRRTALAVSAASVAIAALATLSTWPARAADRNDAEELVEKSRVTVQAMAAERDYIGMRQALAQARAVLVFPQVLRAGFILGGAGGSGVLLVRDTTTGAWTGPAFYTMGSASVGLQAGASAAETVMVIQSQKALDSLYTNKLKLGTDASAALGSRGAEKGSSLNADFVVYAKVRGAFAGVTLDGAVLDVRQTLNTAYYGQSATPLDILVRRSVEQPGAAGLRDALAEAARQP